MVTSQNGWKIVGASACDTAPLIDGIKVPNGVLAGDVAVVFRWLAEQYNARVERLVPGTCWGWYVKTIAGSGTLSNHGSATAVDFNADKHAMGDSASKSFSAAQIKTCKAIVTESGGVLRWGGTYSGRVDSMHWEIVGSAAQVKAFVEEIEDMAIDYDKLANAVLDAKIGDSAWPNRTVRQALADSAAQRDALNNGGSAAGKKPHVLDPVSVLGKLAVTPGNVSQALTMLSALQSNVATLAAKVNALQTEE